MSWGKSRIRQILLPLLIICLGLTFGGQKALSKDEARAVFVVA